MCGKTTTVVEGAEETQRISILVRVESRKEAQGHSLSLQHYYIKTCAEVRSCTIQLPTTNALRTEWLTKNYCVFY